MASKKEKILAEKMAEVEALKQELINETMTANKSSKAKPKKKKKWPKIIGLVLLLIVGLPLALGVITELSLSPEQKAEQALDRKAAQAERQATVKQERIEKAIQKVEMTIKSENYAQLPKAVSELEAISPENAVKYKNNIEMANSIIAEKSRLKKLNYTGNFYIGNYVDEFGDTTGEKFVGYKGTGKFSNSATEGSALNFWISIDSSSDFDISLYEYAGKNPVKDIFGGDAFVIRYRYSGTTDQVTCKNFSDRIACGPKNSAKLQAALRAANSVKFSIYNQRTTSSQYFFSVNANGFTNAMRKLNE